MFWFVERIPKPHEVALIEWKGNFVGWRGIFDWLEAD
jgi:hypothetical protein